ncbi:ABC transporter ATP-binding protein [Tepidimicrobium xylanilyticum]|uniref:ABC-type quaternary amine transporter n=1 Tax=Tepidimicrobium xylanilyticum TaxID=1123352 RepID=A0A1H3E5C6_9FIRM|nr:ABC transporter ATP-binding protein [Tepidimicrobium xylanilyticum]GMG95808.1 ABC transporter ATP-binding protein [Tepidimicrobium xylanilyticum]SDX73820.1 ABC-type Fe3+/spermidine/putrescine transport systems, ATPase components [Tepidimicrobium xylanilyticum]
MPQIKLVNISKKFDNKAVLENIDLTVEEGELVSLLGPSGCGKTTTLKIIAGLLEPDNGDILFDNSSVLDIPMEKRGAVIVFQDYLLFPHLNVYENIEFGLKMAKVDKIKRMDKVNEMLKLVQLEGYEEKFPDELSGGQKQRVALARALAIEPKVLLLDEPFSNLDTRLRETMRDFIVEIQKKLNITTILVTHDKEEALMISNKIALMLNGKIVQFGTPMEIYQKPISLDVANFFGEKNYVVGSIEKGMFISNIITIKANIDEAQRIKAMIKPEDIELIDSYEDVDIKGTVKSRKYAGDRIYYTVLVKDVELKCVSQSSRVFDIGDEVGVKIDFNNVVFFHK